MVALERRRQMNLCEFEASLAYIETFRTARVTLRNPVSNKTKQSSGIIAMTALSSNWKNPTVPRAGCGPSKSHSAQLSGGKLFGILSKL